MVYVGDEINRSKELSTFYLISLIGLEIDEGSDIELISSAVFRISNSSSLLKLIRDKI